MNSINIDKVDLNLLKSLKALLSERHVGRAAQKMNVTQSAMSHTLSRLRDAFDDPLFTRTSKGLEPTPRALALSSRLSLVLGEINSLFAPLEFKPEQLSLTFRIQTHDFIVSSYLANVIKEIRTIAPNLVFDLQSIKGQCYEQLDQGECDLIIGSGLKAKPKFMQQRMIDEQLVCLLDRSHPVMNNWHAESLFRYPHVKLSLLDEKADPVTAYAIDNGLPPRKIGMYTESLQTQPALLLSSQLIAFLPKSLAEQSAAHYGLTVKPCPFELPKLVIKGIWHERSQQEPAHQWIRNMLLKHFVQQRTDF